MKIIVNAKHRGLTNYPSINNSKNYMRQLPSITHYNRVGFFRTCATNKETTPIDVEEILQSLATKFNRTGQEKPFKGVFLTGVQHMLGTTLPMFRALKEKGLEEDNVAVTGKSYSTHLESVEEFKKMGFEFIPSEAQLGYGRFNESMLYAAVQVWQTAWFKMKEKKPNCLIVLDDGADLLVTMPGKFFNGMPIFGVEQTRGGSGRGFFPGFPFPIINAAESCIKKLIEYPKVAEAVSRKIEALIKNEIAPQLLKKPVIGIIGNGSMGSAVAVKLIEEGYTVLAYDKKQDRQHLHPKVMYYPEASLLIMNADIIIGCTGEDVTASHSSNTLNTFLYTMHNKWLISTGSKDMEFNRLLEVIQNETKLLGQTPNPLKNIKYRNRMGSELTIFRGGFPANFDNGMHSVSPPGIWPTRAMLLLACTMCVNLHAGKNPALKTTSVLQLDPPGQLAILREYQKRNPDDECLKPFIGLDDEAALRYIREHSEGEEVPEVSMGMENSANFKL